MSKWLIIMALLVHYVFTMVAWSDHGYAGFFPPFSNTNTIQIFSDLVISLSLVHVWVFFDVKRRGKPLYWFLLHLAGTALTGSFAPMVYLLLRTPTADIKGAAPQNPSQVG